MVRAMRTADLIVAATFSVVMPAIAGSIEDGALACWNPPPALKGQPFHAVFEVSLGKDGYPSDIAVVTFSPAAEAGRAGVKAASRAIEMCAPYDDASGTVRVEFAPNIGSGKPIDPFNGG